MRLPRDLGGAELIARLQRLGYESVRQTGSHVRLTCAAPHAHHITVPLHHPLRVGTLAAILSDVAAARRLSRDELLAQLFA